MTMIARLDDRAVLRIEGTDARDFLQGQLTNDIALLAPGRPIWAGLLNAQGKYLFDTILHDTGDALLADVAADRAAALAQRLAMFRLRRAVAIAPAAGLAVFAGWDGPVDAPYDPRLPGLGRRWIGGAADTSGTAADYDRHRLALGVPDSGDFEIERTMWLETNAVELNGVSFTKGCYVGQENTARMHHRDRLRKRFLPVLLDGDPGEERCILADGREAGTLRSRHAGRGIAFLRLEPVEAGTPLTAGPATLTVDWPSWIGER